MPWRRRKSAEGATVKAARNLGTRLGHVVGRVDALRRERSVLTAELNHVVRVAQGMLHDLDGARPSARRAGKKVVRAVRRARKQFSAEARARIAAAQRKRWAQYRKQKARG